MFILFFLMIYSPSSFLFFFFNDTATTEIYTLSLHDALPISSPGAQEAVPTRVFGRRRRRRTRTQPPGTGSPRIDRKSTRLNSSHGYISYAVFCLKKKKKTKKQTQERATRIKAERNCSTQRTN